MTIEFDDTLITQNELIDSQHKELIDRIKKFVESCEKRDSKADAIRMLDYLADYTDFHFSAEEKLYIFPHRQKHMGVNHNVIQICVVLFIQNIQGMRSKVPAQKHGYRVFKPIQNCKFFEIILMLDLIRQIQRMLGLAVCRIIVHLYLRMSTVKNQVVDILDVFRCIMLQE